MPRTLRPLILAAVVGSALTFGVIGLMSMTQVLPAGQHVLVSYGPSPRDMLQIKDGAPFVVPVGKLFVLRGLGSTEANTACSPTAITVLKVNGQGEVQTFMVSCGNTASISTILALPEGFTVQGGNTVEVSGPSGTGRAWGYLANE